MAKKTYAIKLDGHTLQLREKLQKFKNGTFVVDMNYLDWQVENVLKSKVSEMYQATLNDVYDRQFKNINQPYGSPQGQRV